MAVFTHRRVAFAGVFAAGLLAAAACGTSSTSGSGSGTSSSTGSSGNAATTGGGSVHTVTDAKLGTIVVNGKGFTLYRFDADSAKPSASHCTGTCAVMWRAAPAAAANTVHGVDHQLIGSVGRPGGGAAQLTIAGWPVYMYSHDSKAGQTNGQGVDGTWWAVTPTGGRAAASGSGGMTPSSGTGSGSGSSGGGYGY